MSPTVNGVWVKGTEFPEGVGWACLRRAGKLVGWPC